MVYKITCKTCDATYIGESTRILGLRLKEHSTQPASACFRHTHVIDSNGGYVMERQGNKSKPKRNDHEMDYDNVQVLDTAKTDYKLRCKELLHILEQDPTLNKQLGSQSSYDIKTIIIKAHPQHRK